MTSRSQKSRIARLQEQRDQLNRRIASISAKEENDRRKAENRRKTLIGVAVQQAVKRGEMSDDDVDQLLDIGITNKRDRKFLGLSAVSPLTANNLHELLDAGDDEEPGDDSV